jgi:hypothetical protein
MREEHKLRVVENRVLRRIFGPEEEEVAGDWRRLHNEELHKLYTSQNIIRVIKSMRMRCGTHGICQNCIHDLVGNPERNRPPQRPKRRWENNIRMDVRKKGWVGVDWMHLAQDRDQWQAVVNTVMNLWVP